MPVMGNTAKPDARIQAALAALEHGQACLLAFSGGADSVVLLHALTHLRPDIRLRIAHVDHGLSDASAQWAQHCEQLCQQWQLACVVLRAAHDAPASNVEAWARQQRYALLQEELRAGEALLTAHHLRDQAETLLLNLLRGSGPDGLAAMPSQRMLGSHPLLRPLLAVHPVHIEAYAQNHDLPVLNDPSNVDLRFDRNFLRHQILAPLEQRFPQALNNMARSAALQAQAVSPEAAKLSDDKQPVADFEKHGSAYRNRRLRQWLRSLGLPPPRHRMLDEFWQQLCLAQADANPLLAWPGVELRRYREHLYAMAPLKPVYPLEWLDLPRHGERSWPWGGVVRWQLPDLGEWRISVAQGGERILLRGHHRRLKTLFQEAGIPPWQRQRTPLLWHQQQCIAVGGRWHADNMPNLEFDHRHFEAVQS